MAENNSSAPLKTARFPGEGGHSWTLSLNQLRGLIAELQNQLDSYEEDPDLEVQLVLSFVHPGLVKDEEDGTTNNVPLLTLHDAEYPEEGVYPINPLDCHAGVTIPPQAVAAQAAPAAVVYAEARECSHCNHVGINDSADGVAACISCAWHGDSPKDDKCPECEAEGTMTASCPECHHNYRLLADASIATPALPATEDSSAGDLAEVQAEPVADWLPYSRRVALAARHGQKVTGPFNALVRDVIATYLDTHGATAPQAQPADALTQAALDVLAERARQIGKEGYDPTADDQYVDAELAAAAATYALLATGTDGWRVDDHWPWTQDTLKKGKARRMLEKAGALILAEMERLDRAAMAAAQEGGNAEKEA